MDEVDQGLRPNFPMRIRESKGQVQSSVMIATLLIFVAMVVTSPVNVKDIPPFSC